jgi:hypothetical protein
MDRGAEENCVTKREGCPLNNRVQRCPNAVMLEKDLSRVISSYYDFQHRRRMG